MPSKRLLERGKISGTQESVKKRLKTAAAGYKKAEKNVKSSVPHKLEQVMANAGQAPIMLVGKAPPGKEKVPGVLEEMFVEIGEDLAEFGDVGEKNPEDVTGEMLDEHLEKADRFVKRMHKLVSQLGSRKKVKNVVEDYKKFLKANVAALKSKGVEPPEDKEDLPEVVEQNLDVDDEHIQMFDRWEDVVSKVKNESMDEVDDKELYDLKEETRDFVSSVGKDIQKAKQEKAQEMTPNVDPSEAAKNASDEDIIPNLQKEAEKKVNQEDEDEEK
jgi:hypothetical protein